MNLEATTEAVVMAGLQQWFTGLFQAQVQLHFLYFPGALAKGDITQHGLGSPKAIIYQQHAPQACSLANFTEVCVELTKANEHNT